MVTTHAGMHAIVSFMQIGIWTTVVSTCMLIGTRNIARDTGDRHS